MDARNLTLHIIYTGGTVQALLPFACTLLDASPCRLMLVANGCTPEEEALLQHLAESNRRISMHSLGVREMLPHGHALNRLFAGDGAPWFAFLDSDIFANGPFLDAQIAQLRGHDALFSCLPVWHEAHEVSMPAHFHVMGGRFVRAHTGQTIGVTYYAIYRREAVQRVMDEFGVDFRRYEWDKIPAPLRERIGALGLRKRIYDTAKVLNLALEIVGCRTTYVESPHLVHVGAASGAPLATPDLPQPLHKRLYYGLRYRVARIRHALRGGSLAEFDDTRRLMRKRRAAQILLARSTGVLPDSTSSGAVPVSDTIDPALRAKLEWTGEQIVAVYRRAAACLERTGADVSQREDLHTKNGLGAQPAARLEVAPTPLDGERT